MANKVQPADKKPSRDFQWALGPMWISLWLVGNILTPLKRPPILYRLFIYLWGLAFLAVCLSCHIIQLYITFAPLYAGASSSNSTVSTENTNTVLVNLSIDYFSFFVYAAGIQIFLFIITAPRWPDLCRIIAEFEKCITMNPNVYKQLRWASFILFFLIRFEHAYYLWMALFQAWLDEGFWIRFMNHVPMFSLLYPSTATSLYGLVGWTVVKMLQTIRNQVELYFPDPSVLESHTVLQWKKAHRLACDLVHRLNRCFSFILVFNVTYAFISSISYTFYFLASFKQDGNASLVDLTSSGSQMGKGFVQLGIITFVPAFIRNECFKLGLSLYKLHLEDGELQYKVDALAKQVMSTIPGVKAGGLFPVTPALFPQLLGTALTYVIIMYQFQAAEIGPSSVTLNASSLMLNVTSTTWSSTALPFVSTSIKA